MYEPVIQGFGSSTGRPGAVEFSAFYHGKLVLIAISFVILIWMFCRLVVYLMHRGKLLDPKISTIEQNSINSMLSNDMAALIGTLAGLSTLSLAVSTNIPVDYTIVLTVMSGALAFLSAGYWISSNRNLAQATYAQINKASF